MADTKTSALTAASALAGTEVVPGVQSAASVKISGNQLTALALSSLHPGFISTRWYGPVGSVFPLNAATTADFLYCIPLLIPVACTITDVGVYVNTGAGSAKFGLYNTVAGVPSARLGITTTAGTSMAASGAFQSGALTVAQAVTPGVYWAAVLFDNTPAVNQVPGGDPLISYLIGADTGAHVVGGPSVTGYTGTGTYTGGMNTTFTSPVPRYGNTPAIAFKVQ